MPRPAVIDRAMVSAAALELIDEQGLSKFRLDRLAAKLGVKAATFYYHFEDKADILASVVELIVRETPAPRPHDGVDDWRDWIVTMAVGLRQAALRRPNAAPLLLEMYSKDLTFATYERTAEVLDRCGVSAHAQYLIFEGVEKLLLGSIVTAIRPSRTRASNKIDRRRYPMLMQIMAGNKLNDEELFAAAVRSFLHGIDEVVRPAGGALPRAPSSGRAGRRPRGAS